jgi:hypothetical protein
MGDRPIRTKVKANNETEGGMDILRVCALLQRFAPWWQLGLAGQGAAVPAAAETPTSKDVLAKPKRNWEGREIRVTTMPGRVSRKGKE